MTNEFSIKRTFLYTVIAALVLSALMGIYVLLSGEFRETEGRILGTTLVVSLFSMLSLACAAAHEKGECHWPLSIPGLALGAGGLVFYILAIWLDWWRFQTASQWLAILGIFSFSFAQASVLSLARLRRQVHWVFYAAVISILALAVFVSGMILAEPSREVWPFRVVGILGILDGCFSLCVPIVQRLGGKEPVAAGAETYHEIELACPRCGAHATYPLGKIACRKCSLALRIEIG
jgi:hypothetical protein